MLNEDQHRCFQIKFKPRLNVRNQNSQWGGGCFGSLGAEPPKAIGGPRAKPPAAANGKIFERSDW